MVGEFNAKVEGESSAGKVYVFGIGEPVVEQKPEPEQEPAEAVTEPEEEPSFWERIPGFQYESIALGLAVCILVLWLIQRRG